MTELRTLLASNIIINRYHFESHVCDSLVFTKLVSHMLGSPLFYHSDASL